MSDFSIEQLQWLAALAGYPDTEVGDPSPYVLIPDPRGKNGQRQWRPHVLIDQAEELIKALIKRGWKDGKIEWCEYGFRCLLWWMSQDEPLYDKDNLEDFSPTPAIAICKMALRALDFECKLVSEKQ